MVNETLDRILLKYMLPLGEGETAIGIYGACYKISILLTLFRQAFAYASEPFFFSQRNAENAKEIYAKVMQAFVIFSAFIFLATTVNLSWIQYFIGQSFRVGLRVVPILLLANLFLGIYFNLGIWYKLTGRTRSGMWITLIGATITLVLNFIWIPSQGYFASYMGSAWATLICYASMMLISYFAGQHYYPIAYNVPRILGYIGLAILLHLLAVQVDLDNYWLNLFVKNLFLLPFVILAWKTEKPLNLFRKKPEKPLPS
jgi:O-antigen/teichoic acid export membrane protein